jgi:hypothetical protein
LAESGFGGSESARVVAAQLKELRRFIYRTVGRPKREVHQDQVVENIQLR